jgi:hypothetical protein
MAGHEIGGSRVKTSRRSDASRRRQTRRPAAARASASAWCGATLAPGTETRLADLQSVPSPAVIRVAAFEIVEGILHKGYASPMRVKYAKGEPIANAHGMLVPLIRLAGQDLDISISNAR